MNITDEEVLKHTEKEILEKYNVSKHLIDSLFIQDKGRTYLQYKSYLSANPTKVTTVTPPKERFINYSAASKTIDFIGNYTKEEKFQQAQKLLDRQILEIKTMKDIIAIKEGFVVYLQTKLSRKGKK